MQNKNNTNAKNNIVSSSSDQVGGGNLSLVYKDEWQQAPIKLHGIATNQGLVDVAEDISTAGSLSVGTSVSGEIEIADNKDQFIMLLEAGKQYRIELSSIGELTKFDKYVSLADIVDSNGVSIFPPNANHHPNEWDNYKFDKGRKHINFTVAESGEYFIGVDCFYIYTGDYKLSLSHVPDLEASINTQGQLDELVLEDDTLDEAAYFFIASYTHDQIETSGDVDWFRMRMEAGQLVHFNTTPNFNLVAIYDSNGELLIQFTNGDDYATEARFMATTSGDYFIAVAGQGAGTGAYRLSAKALNRPVVNGELEQGVIELTPDRSFSGQIDSPFDEDLFRIYLNVGQELFVSLNGVVVNAQEALKSGLLSIYNDKGMLIESVTDGTSGSVVKIAITATYSGDYYIAVGSGREIKGFNTLSEKGTGAYTLSTELSNDLDLADDTSTTGSLSVGGSVIGMTGKKGDQDWFKIHLDADQHYRFNATSTDGWPHARLAIYDNSGVLIKHGNSITVTETGDYFIAVNPISNIGVYELSASLIPDLEASTDTLGQLNAVDFDSNPVSGATGQIETSGDEDWFRIYLQAGQEVRLSVDFWGNRFTEILAIYNNNGDLIQSIDALEAIFMATESNDYYIAVGGSDIESYQLSVSAQNKPVVDGEQDNGAIELKPDHSVMASIDRPYDRDMFRIYLDKGQQVLLDLESSSGMLESILLDGIYDSNSNLIAGTSAIDLDVNEFGSRPFMFTAPESGNYYIVAVSDKTGNYKLSANVYSDLAADTSTTGVLGVGDTVINEIELKRDQDWFRISLEAGNTYQFEIRGSGDDRDTYFTIRAIYDSSGIKIKQSVNDKSNFSFIATETGDYFIAVNAMGDSTGVYELSASLIPDLAASTDTLGQLNAVDFDSNRISSATGQIETSGDEDWFRIYLQAGQEVRLSAWGNRFTELLGIYNSNGDLIQGVNGSKFVFMATESDDYYIAVGGSDIESYQLSVSAQNKPVVDGEQDNGAIELKPDHSVMARIDRPHDRDVFRIYLDKGQQVLLDIDSNSADQGMLERIWLDGIYDSNSNLITGTNDILEVDDDLALIFTASESGNYYIVAASCFGQTGNYNLSASLYSDLAADSSTTGVLEIDDAVIDKIELERDEDWFQIHLVKGYNYHFKVESSGDTSFIGGLYDSNGIEIANANRNIWNFMPTDTGNYYIAVFGNTGTYRLSATSDLNANIYTAGRLEVDGSVTDEIETGGDQDWFRIYLEAGYHYRFDIQGSGDDQDNGFFLESVYDSNGERADSIIKNYDSDMVFFTANYTGHYYISAAAFESAIGSYDLSANRVIDIADNTSTSASLSVHDSITHHIEIAGDLDWIRVDLEAGHNYQFQIMDISNTQNADFFLEGLYDSNGERVEFSLTNVDRNIIEFTPTNTGSYYIAAGGLGSNIGIYELSVTEVITSLIEILPMDTTIELAADTSTSGQLSVGGSVTSLINTIGDQDWFRIDLNAGQGVRIDLEGEPTEQGTLSDPYLYGMHDSNGNFIFGTSNDDGGSGYNSQIIFTAEQSGSYYVAAGGFGSNTGSYQLSATALQTSGAGNNILEEADEETFTFPPTFSDYLESILANYARELEAMVDNPTITLDADNSMGLRNVQESDLLIDDFRFI